MSSSALPDAIPGRTPLPGGGAAPRWPTRSCAATCGKATADDPRQARRRSSTSCPTGRRCARPGGRSRSARCATSTTTCCSSRRRSRAPAATSTGRATPPRRTAIVAGIVQATRRREVVKVKSLTTDEIELNEALEAAGHRGDRDRPRRADRPARPATARRTSSCRRSTRTAPRSATSSARTLGAGRPHRRARASWPRRRGATCASSSCSATVGDQRRELRRRRDGHDLRRRVRGQRPHVPDAARRR